MHTPTRLDGQISSVIPPRLRVGGVSPLGYLHRVIPNCPNCGHSNEVREIFYGLPALPIDEDKYEIGGCCIYPGMPLFKCRECGWTSDEFPNAHETLECWYCGQKDALKQINFLITGSTDYNRFIWDGGQLEMDSRPIYRCNKCGWQGSLVFLGEKGQDPL